MIRAIIGFTLASALAAAGFAPAAAQSAPPGSYQQTCRNAHVDGSRLEAQCANAEGSLVSSSVDLGSCGNADITNINGSLRCVDNGRVDNTNNGNGGLPRGSYRQSCNNTSFQAGTLSATCSNPNGPPITSSLDTSGCQPDSDIVAVNGRLQCRIYATAAPAQSELTLRALRPESNAAVETRRPTIEAQFGQSQVDPNTVRVVLDGLDVTNASSRSPSGIVFSPPSDLQSGQHTIHVSGRDVNGLPFDRAWQFTTGSAALTNFITDLQPANNATVDPALVVTGHTEPNSHVIVQVAPVGDQQLTVNGAIGQVLGIGPRVNALRVETNADANGAFSVQVNIGAGSGQPLELIVDSTDPRTQAAASTRRTLVVR